MTTNPDLMTFLSFVKNDVFTRRLDEAVSKMTKSDRDTFYPDTFYPETLFTRAPLPGDIVYSDPFYPDGV